MTKLQRKIKWTLEEGIWQQAHGTSPKQSFLYEVDVFESRLGRIGIGHISGLQTLVADVVNTEGIPLLVEQRPLPTSERKADLPSWLEQNLDHPVLKERKTDFGNVAWTASVYALQVEDAFNLKRLLGTLVYYVAAEVASIPYTNPLGKTLFALIDSPLNADGRSITKPHVTALFRKENSRQYVKK